MRNLLITLIFTSISLVGYAQQKSDYTLGECIEYALQNSEILRITSIEKEISNAVVGETRGVGLPQVNVNGGLNHNFEVQKSLVDFSNFDPTLPEGTEGEIAFGQAYDGNLSLGIDQLIFDGSYFVALRAAQTFRELSTKDHIKSEIDIVENVSKAYFTALVNEERLALLEKNYDRIDTLVRETRAMYENGFAEKIDVDRLRVNRNNLRVERDRLRKLNEISFKLLKFQMGMPLDQEINLTETLEEVDLILPVMPSDFTYGDRVEYSSILTNQELVNLDMKNNKVQRLPKVYGSLSYGYNTASAQASEWFTGDRWLNYGTLGVSVSLNLFNGLSRNYKIQQNQLKIDQLEFHKSYLQKSIDLEIAQSRINLNSSVEALEVQHENMALAQDVYNISKIKYQEGVGSNLEVTQADADLKEAQTNYYNAMYDAIIARIDLLKALGRLHK